MVTEPQTERAAKKVRTDEAFKVDTPAHSPRVGVRVIIPLVVVLIGIILIAVLFVAPR
jgi:hypothetical protein